MGFLIVLVLLAGVAALLLASALRRHRREAFVRGYRLPRGLFARLQARHPQLALRDCELVAHGLRQFFLAHLKSGRQPVAMPSQVADDLWHEFILHTRAYDAFCRRAFGRFLHHTPAVAPGSAVQHDAGLRRVWWQACREEHVDPRQPSRLPLLFALDTKFGIAGGFRYVPDCHGPRREHAGGGPVHCGGDFATAGGGDAGGDGFGDGDGGGDGGGGCGGD